MNGCFSHLHTFITKATIMRIARVVEFLCARRIFFICFLLIVPAVLELLLPASYAAGQIIKKSHFRFQSNSENLPSNFIGDILIVGADVWLGSGGGLSLTTDNGFTFTNFSGKSGMGKGGTSAIAYNNGVIWVATGYDTLISEESLDAGGGLSWSENKGATWRHIPQPVDPNNEDSLGYKPTTTHVQNITYDIAFHNDKIWIASWGGGLRKSGDNGLTWTVVTPDGMPFTSLNNLNHTPFSIVSADNGLWVGTALGVNRSTDGGETWTNYTAQNSGMSGNFVTALGKQEISGQTIIWAATWKTFNEEEYYGISRTTNNGLTWDSMLEGEFAHNFEFDGDQVYVVTDNGLFKSSDRGEHWGSFPWIRGLDGTTIFSSKYYSVAYGNGILWVGTGDGLAKSLDGGVSWAVLRSFPEPGKQGEPNVYAYPNPFSPFRHNRLGDTGHVRIQYSISKQEYISLDIFDFGMNTVKNVIRDRFRSSAGSYAEMWDGTNKWGKIVANGVYFYRLTIKGGSVFWGKIIVLN